MADVGLKSKNSARAIVSTSTIAALATAPAPAGVAIVRVCGPSAKDALSAIFQAKTDPIENPRVLVLGNVVDFNTKAIIDHALIAFMPGPHSYTGEDTVEFQFHGSPLLVQKVLRSLFAFGVVPAEPGEFTKRAFLNGKIDLLQAEAVADLINASSDEALVLAGEQLKGRTSRLIDRIAEPLRDMLAETEASLDFSDDGVSQTGRDKISAVLRLAAQHVQDLVKSYEFGSRVKDGLRVLLFGRPNVGKSSLLNVFVGSRRALVSAQPGTTRDLIEECVNVDGYQLVLSDVAGVRETTDDVESQGVAIARERVRWAHVVLLIVDAAAPADWRDLLKELCACGAQVWLIVNKVDTQSDATERFNDVGEAVSKTFFVSAVTGAGIEALRSALVAEISALRFAGIETGCAVINERQRSCLVQALSQIQAAIEGGIAIGDEIIAHHVRLALAALEELVGKTYADDLLGRIFSKFCIGK